ncbi:MAG: lytic murein transglycosylase [Hyphomicrobiales bacterium]
MIAFAGMALPVPLAAKTAYQQAVEAGYGAWLEELKRDALSRGISGETFDTAMKGVRPDWSLPDLDPPELGAGQPERPKAVATAHTRQQPEFDKPANYFPAKSISHLAVEGRKLLGEHASALEKIEKDYGVDKTVVLAIWGRETGFGRVKIPHDAVRALATQAFIGRRKEMFREELFQALLVLQDGHIGRGRMVSSWAGAMGHTQFLPSDYRKYGVDFDGDGRKDIWGTVEDALASTANSLKQNGWEAGKTWGYEVRLPKDFDCTLEGPQDARPVADWLKSGVTRTHDRTFKDSQLADVAYLVVPAGLKGPAFLVLRSNFQAIRAYNTADLYALYVGHVADRIYGEKEFEGRWARIASFTRGEVRQMQEHLHAQGVDVGKIDGLMGGKTRRGVGLLQKQLKLPVTCYPDRELLARIRQTGN